MDAQEQVKRLHLAIGLTDAMEQTIQLASAPPARIPFGSTTFHSILFERSEGGSKWELLKDPPVFFRDLNLDQIVDAITHGREEYDLKPFFYTRLSDPAEIAYRHEIMRDLENEFLFQSIKSFSERMRTMRKHLRAAEKLSYKYQKERWFLDAVETYGEAVENLLLDLRRVDPKSRGLLAFRRFLAQYAQSGRFTTLLHEEKEIRTALAAVRYCLLIKGSSITVRTYAAEGDYSTTIEEAFAKFKQGAVKDYKATFPDFPSMNHVEERVLELVAKLNPAVFQALDDYCARNRDYLDRTIADFDREIQFYAAYLEHVEKFKNAGLKFCYPKVSDQFKNVSNCEGFDLALAGKLIQENSPVVCNDFFLDGNERIFVVTGPNQGGKTTFARTFGQLHYLASLGCPVAGAEARLFLVDRLFTHFEKEEDLRTLRGKLQDDLLRIHHILKEATPNSVIIMNEIFSSTTLNDAAYLSRKVMERISRLDSLCVCVTFLDELSSLNEKTVSVVATIVPENPTLRTHRIERKPADGLSYALAIAEKYRLTYERLKERTEP